MIVAVHGDLGTTYVGVRGSDADQDQAKRLAVDAVLGSTVSTDRAEVIQITKIVDAPGYVHPRPGVSPA